MKKLPLLFLFVALILGACSKHDLTLQEIIEKNLEASGGKDKMNAVKSISFEANMTLMGMNMPMKLYMVKPNQIAVIVTAMNKQQQVVINGNEGWTYADGKMMLLDSNQLKSMKEQMSSQYAFADNILNDYAKRGIKIEMAPKDSSSKSGKDEYYKLKATTKENVVMFLYINKQTFLLDKITMDMAIMNQSASVEILMKDYKTVSGLNLPHTVEMAMNGAPMGTIKLTKVDINGNIDASIFTKPQNAQIVSPDELSKAAQNSSTEEGPVK